MVSSKRKLGGDQDIHHVYRTTTIAPPNHSKASRRSNAGETKLSTIPKTHRYYESIVQQLLTSYRHAPVIRQKC
jgi:hypothetical protein